MPEGGPSVPRSAALAPLHTEARPVSPPASTAAPAATEVAHPSPSLADKFFQGAGVNATTEQGPKNALPVTESNLAKPPTEIKTSTAPNPKTESQPTPDHQSNPGAQNYYDRLGLKPDATPEEIKSAFRQAAREYHPDRNPKGEEEMKNLNEAFDILSDIQKRGQYDKKLKACENLSDADLNRAATTADALYNIAGDGKIGSYLQTEMRNRLGISPETATPQQIAGLLPDLAAPLAEQLAHPEQGIPFVIPLTPEDVQVLKAVDKAYKSKNPEAMMGLEIALQMLLLLIMMINILQKAAAHEDWGESFDVLAKQAGATGEMAGMLKSMIKLKRSSPEQPAAKEKPKSPAVTPNTEPVHDRSSENTPQEAVKPSHSEQTPAPEPQIPVATETPSRIPATEPETILPSTPPELTANTTTHPETIAQTPPPEPAESQVAPEIPPEIPEITMVQTPTPEPEANPAAIPVTEPSLTESAAQAVSAPIPAPPIFTSAPVSVPVSIPTPV